MSIEHVMILFGYFTIDILLFEVKSPVHCGGGTSLTKNFKLVIHCLEFQGMHVMTSKKLVLLCSTKKIRLIQSTAFLVSYWKILVALLEY